MLLANDTWLVLLTPWPVVIRFKIQDSIGWGMNGDLVQPGGSTEIDEDSASRGGKSEEMV